MNTFIDAQRIGKILKEHRRSLGKTMDEVSTDTGIGRTALNNYELGIRVPRDEAKFILARYYGFSVKLFFEDDGTERAE